jgi:vacuolar iron transporter family protein
VRYRWAWVALWEQRAKRECEKPRYLENLFLLTSNRESYQATKRKCQQLMRTSKTITSEIVQNHFRNYQLDEDNSAAISKTINDSPETLISFLMTHHFDAAEPPDSRPWISALTLAVAYFSGGFIPLIPYFAVRKDDVLKGLWWSIGIMAVVLLIFGYVKTCVVRGWRGKDNVIAGLKGAIQMALVGAAAAGAAVGLVRAINHEGYSSGS